MSEAAPRPAGGLFGCARQAIGLVVVLAAGLQLYRFAVSGRITDGPLPLQEARSLLVAARQMIRQGELGAARERVERVLDRTGGRERGNTAEAEALRAEAALQLRELRRLGHQVADRPELKQPVALRDVEGGGAALRQLSERTLRATGRGYPPQGAAPGPAGLLAERAAQVDAQRQLLAELHGMAINERLNLGAVLDQTEVRAGVDGVVRGARQVARRSGPNGLVEVELVLEGPALARALAAGR